MNSRREHRIRPAGSSESARNTREEYTIGKETNEFVTEVYPTVETAFDTDITPDAKAIPGTEIIPDIPIIPGAEVTTDVEITETLTRSRSLDDIREEFCSHYRNGSESAYRMGKLLNEAKAQLPERGKWLDWLRGVNYPERQAQRLMKLANSYPDPTTLSLLGQSKALALLKVDSDKREEFIREPHMIHKGGIPMQANVHEMSVRQLENAIRKNNGTPKKKAPESTSHTLPLMPNSDTFGAYGFASGFNRPFEHLQLCINSLLDHLEGLADSSNERGELADKLRQLCNEALQRIPMS